MQKGVGHYGVFNGSRFRKEIVPAIMGFMRANHKSSERREPKVKLVSSR